jgi:hypothetical protein
MPALLLSTAPIELKSAKTNGLTDLGVPMVESTLVKKGKLGEFDQLQDSGKIGRRFQNLRAILVKAEQGGETHTTLILSLEAFGDDNVPVAGNQGVSVQLLSGDKLLAEHKLGALFLPFGSAWYDNRFAVELGKELFDACDKVNFVAHADEVRAL